MLNYIAKQIQLKQVASAAVLCLSVMSVNANEWQSDSRMNLGHWKQSISDRIYPNFFESLTPSPLSFAAEGLSFEGAKLYFSSDRFQHLSQLTEGKTYFFTFDYDESVLQPVNFYDATFTYDQLLISGDSFSRSYIAPGVAYQANDHTEYNFSVVFAQQNYNDVNFLSSKINAFDQLDLYGVTYTETNNGLGLNLGMKQKLYDWLSVETQYQSKINMDGFSRLVGVQADPADFDIPENISVTVGLQVTERNVLRLNAKRSYFKDINAFVSPSFPSIFLTFLNDLESPEFAWDNQTMFSAALEHQFNNGALVTVEYSGRQQPPATDEDLTTILNAISADYSVRVGLSAPMLGGQIDLYASYAPKPLNFGRTDFGQVDDVLEGKHAEAVVSWMYQF